MKNKFYKKCSYFNCHIKEYVRLIRKGLKYWQNGGVKELRLRLYVFINKKKEEKEFGEVIPSMNVTMPYYDSWYQADEDFSKCNTEVKPIAFYLPQYHQFPENDMWWGEGFTDWCNTQKAIPQYKNQYLPRVPHSDIGYYDLTEIENLKKQVILAKKHGVWGFCFYYYWFSGKKLMERPIDLLLMHPEIELNFCLCWANENFTRAWDGDAKSILMQQEYSVKDPCMLIHDMKRFILDERYIKVDGKPLLIIYNMSQIPKPKFFLKELRKHSITEGIGELYICSCQTTCTAKELCIEEFIDAEIQFPPHNMRWNSIRINEEQIEGASGALLFNYSLLVKYAVHKMYHRHRSQIPLFYCCMMGWDNTARRKTGWTSYINYSLKDFYTWTKEIVDKTRQEHNKETRIFFVNAWNEWAEGTYLEPDKRYGYANINTFSRALFGKTFISQNNEKEIS